EFQQRAVDRMHSCESVAALARELGVSRRSLYFWQRILEPVKGEEEAQPPAYEEASLRRQVHQLKRLLADKTLEVDFFRGALQKVEARRQRSGKSGGTASTSRSGE
ncbi:MAG TPA: helix-turn-helix domain-containing protein, partial [Terriglobia bacterium]|nr:helix-turn-helix domain-containing protein [Terriglobia bacterium]